MKFLSVLLSLFILVSCASVKRVPTNGLRVLEYNTVASQYMYRPTTVEIEKRNGPDDRLRIEYSKYGSEIAWVNFTKENVDAYLSLIDKYLAWEKTASARKDQLDKVIGEAPLWLGASLQFRFYSANENTHYLIITAGSPITLDKKNAMILKNMLLKFKNNKLNLTDETIYR